MIDFIKIRYQDIVAVETFVLDKENFEQCFTKMEYHTGQPLYPIIANFNKMEVRVNEKSVYLKNSIHKMMNDIENSNAHNYDDFNYTRLCKAIDHINSKVRDSNTAKITQLEFGININVDVPAEHIISKNIIFHKEKLHNVFTDFNGKGKYKQFEYNECYFKIYDKAKQFKLSTNILRIEDKYKSSKALNRLGIYKLEDLKDKSILNKLFEKLLNRFKQLTIIDDVLKISEEDNKQLTNYLSYGFWEVMSKRENRNKKIKEKKKFNELLIKNDLLKLKSSLEEKLTEKFNQLINH